MENNQTVSESDLTELGGTKNEPEWNAICDRVKKRCGGYPPDWYGKVVASGLLARTAASWGKPPTASTEP